MKYLLLYQQIIIYSFYNKTLLKQINYKHK